MYTPCQREEIITCCGVVMPLPWKIQILVDEAGVSIHGLKDNRATSKFDRGAR